MFFQLEIFKIFKETVLAQSLLSIYLGKYSSWVTGSQNEVMFKGQNTALNTYEIFSLEAEGQLL